MGQVNKEVKWLPPPEKITVNSLGEFSEVLLDGGYRDYLFRGEPAKYNSIVSSALREFNSIAGRHEYPFIQMKDEFKREVFHKLSVDERASFLAFAQHHGLPTNLVDVTHSPLVAMYFACQPFVREQGEKSGESPGYIYLLEDKMINISGIVTKYEDENILELFAKNRDDIFTEFYKVFHKYESEHPQAFYAKYRMLINEWNIYCGETETLPPLPIYAKNVSQTMQPLLEYAENVSQTMRPLPEYAEDTSLTMQPLLEYAEDTSLTMRPLPEYTEDTPQTMRPLPEYAEDTSQTMQPLPEYAEDSSQTLRPLPEYAEDSSQTLRPLPEYTEDTSQTMQPLPEYTEDETETMQPLPEYTEEEVPASVRRHLFNYADYEKRLSEARRFFETPNEQVMDYLCLLQIFLKNVITNAEAVYYLNGIPSFIYDPILPFERGRNQNGLFIYEGYISYTEQVSDTPVLARQRIWPDKVIVVNNKARILETLDMLGINEKYIYGDYDSIARYIKRKHR